MASKISFTCEGTHQGEDRGRGGPTITLVENEWAYCGHSGYTNHTWKRLDGDGLLIDEIALRGMALKRELTA
jgi:hypothetical protein